MTVATTPDFKPPGVTSKHDLKDAKLSRQSQSAPLEKKSNNYNILPVTQVLQHYELVTVSKFLSQYNKILSNLSSS